MCQQAVEILPALVNHRCQSDNLRTGTDDNQQLQLSIILKMLYLHNMNIRLIRALGSAAYSSKASLKKFVVSKK
jgi:hypothetical protein